MSPDANYRNRGWNESWNYVCDDFKNWLRVSQKHPDFFTVYYPRLNVLICEITCLRSLPFFISSQMWPLIQFSLLLRPYISCGEFGKIINFGNSLLAACSKNLEILDFIGCDNGVSVSDSHKNDQVLLTTFLWKWDKKKKLFYGK